MTTSRRLFKFSAPGNELMPKPSPEQKPNPEVVTSGESDFESAKGSPTHEPTGLRESPAYEQTRSKLELHPWIESLDEARPHYDTETKRAALAEEPTHYLLENPEDEPDLDPLVESSYFTEPHPNQPLYSPIENLFSAIQTFNQPIYTITMAQPVQLTNGAKELNLNKPEVFDGNRNSFKDFLQTVEVYMDVNHKTYNNDLRKIAFVLSFMTTGAAATWKAQFIDEAYSWPIPANPNDRLGTYAQFRKDLKDAFSMFDSVGNALDELRSLRKKQTESIDEHIAKFKMLAAELKIDTTNPLTIELFKETLPWGLTLQLMKLETPLKTITDWYEWAAELDHKHAKINKAVERTRGTSGGKDKAPQKKYYFPQREQDPNAMDVDRLTIKERDKLLKEGKCFRCQKIGHRANECPENDDKKKKGKEVPKKKMNGRELHAHMRALFKEMTEEDRDEFLKGAEEAGFWKGELDQRQCLLI
jgi:Ty3 transposon capsid-like protein/Zinc knuckle